MAIELDVIVVIDETVINGAKKECDRRLEFWIFPRFLASKINIFNKGKYRKLFIQGV